MAAQSLRYDRLLQQYNTAEPKPEQIKTLLENLGQLQKEPPRFPAKAETWGKLQDSDINILEMAEPNGRDFDG